MLKYLLFFLFISNMALANNERYYQEKYCKGFLEYKFDDGTKADCLTEDYVTEFDFAYKWFEAVGQSLHYALKSGKKPSIVLILKTKKHEKHIKNAIPLCKKYGIKLDFIRDY